MGEFIGDVTNRGKVRGCVRYRSLSIVDELTFASLAMRYRSGWVSVITFATIMTVSSRCEMSTLQADTSAHATRQLVQFHVESAFSGVQVAVANCNE